MLLQENYPRLITAEAEVVISFDGRNGLEVGCKKLPVVCRNQDCSVSGNKLGSVAFADFSTISLISSRQVMFVLLYRRLNSPKHQSGLN